MTARETRRIEQRQLLAYVQLSRRSVVGRESWIRITLDTTQDDTSQGSENGAAPFENVTLRFPRALLDNLSLVAISPAPDAATLAGSGRYFRFRRLKRDQTIEILVRPRRVGKQSISLFIDARNCLPLRVSGVVQVRLPDTPLSKTRVKTR